MGANQKPIDVELKSKRGYFSKTLSTFVLGTIGSHEWIGNDFINSSLEVYEYTATALNEMIAYEVPKKEMLAMPPDFLNTFKHELELRHNWIMKRISSEARSVSMILKKEPDVCIDENFREAIKRYPLAQKDALLEIRKQYNTIDKPPSPQKTYSSVRLVPLQKQRAGSIDALGMQSRNESPSSIDKKDSLKYIKMLDQRYSPVSSPRRERRQLLNCGAADALIGASSLSPKLVPTCSTRNKKLKIELTPLPNKLQYLEKIEFEKNKKITICNRKIELLDKKEDRGDTPNPFSIPPKISL